MKNAIILHGGPTREEYFDKAMPSQSNSHWLPWFQQQLQVHSIPAATPEIPNAYDRNWQVWQKEVERFDIGPSTILVGHSTGAGFWVKYLSINKNLKVGKVVLVAPWLDPGNEHTKNFFDDFQIDPDIAGRTESMTIFNSDNDEDSVQESTKIIREKVRGVKYKEFHNYGHFCYEDMHTVEFPELLVEILS